MRHITVGGGREGREGVATRYWVMGLMVAWRKGRKEGCRRWKEGNRKEVWGEESDDDEEEEDYTR